MVPLSPLHAEAKPNILVCIADDWSWPHASVYGDKVVQTPNFDHLARAGILFHRAYTLAPSCSPSRAGLLTGQAPHRLEAGGNLWGTLPARYPVYPELLEGAGYFVGFTGKGWGPGNFEAGGRKRPPAGPRYPSFADFLKQLPPDKPFCFWFGSTDPHRPYEPGSGARAGLKSDAIPAVPGCWPDLPEVREDLLDYYAEVQRFDRDLGSHLQQLSAAGLEGNTIVVVTSDNGMPFPRCKANLYDLGTRMPLALRWPARVKAGQSTTAFVSHADLAPTFLEAAGLPIPGAMTGKSLLPLLANPTVTEGRGMVFVERERHANVRQGDLSYPSRAVRTERYLYIRNLRPDRWPAGDPETYFAVGPYGDIDGGPTKDILLRGKLSTARWGRLFELACGKRPAEEFYDCQHDPWELQNLADEPQFAAIKAGLRRALDQWMEETADPRATPSGGNDRWDKFPYFGQPVKRP
jgi:arylsulfatase A-like enzyme